MVHLKRENLKTFYTCDTSEEESAIKDALTVEVPNYFFSPSYKRGFWDGTKKFYDKRAKFFWFGLIERVLDELSSRDINYAIEGYDEEDIEDIVFSPFFTSNDRDYQRNSIVNFLCRKYGVIKVPTRGGKTFIAAEILRIVKPKKCLFLTDSVDIFSQVPDDFSKIIGDEKFGKIQGLNFSIERINIGMIQTIQASLFGARAKDNFEKKRKFEKFLSEVDFLIIDEVHEFTSSDNRLNTVRKCKNAEYLLSLSATPEKDTGEIQRMNLESITGGIIYDIDENILVKRGVLAENKAMFILNKISTESDYRDSVQEGLTANEHRNNLIKKTIKVCQELKLKTLVMFRSTEHGKNVSEQTGIEFVYGDHSEAQRTKLKDEFLNKSGGVLFSSYIWKKGITLPTVEVLINADGGQESSLIIQIRGRVLGTTGKKKKALFIDFLDLDNKFLESHSISRMQTIQNKIGKTNIICIDGDDSDFEYDLKDELIEFFNKNQRS